MDKDFSIKRILNMLKSHIKLMIILTVVGGILGYAYYDYVTIPLYTASATVIVQNTNPSAYEESTLEDATSVQAITPSDINTSIGMAKVLANLLKNDSMLQELSTELGGGMSANALNGLIVLEAVNNTPLLRVTVTAQDAVFAAEVVNTFTELIPKYFSLIYPAGTIKEHNRAQVPANSITQGPRNMIIYGTAGGLILGILLAFLIELIDTTVKPDDDLYNMYKIPVFASIVEIDNSKRKKHNRETARKSPVREEKRK